MATSHADLVLATASVIAAAGGVGGAIGALKAFQAQRDANKTVNERLNAQDETDRRAQAVRISVSATLRQEGSTFMDAVVRNRSELPIFGLRLWVEGPDSGWGQVSSPKDVLDTWDDWEMNFELTHIPGQLQTVPRVVLEFVDNAQVRWQRFSDGTMTEPTK